MSEIGITAWITGDNNIVFPELKRFRLVSAPFSQMSSPGISIENISPAFIWEINLFQKKSASRLRSTNYKSTRLTQNTPNDDAYENMCVCVPHACVCINSLRYCVHGDGKRKKHMRRIYRVGYAWHRRKI